ncbi:hypothetical protein [Photorhabdus cinerea]|uniref:Uncharacterized protein n=1 Tax=Photorhabdus cinerea TaxID=471575 RepID=A0A7X5TFQ0_9GAMM|nr:hypothetical protein [Photorhabdus cinerea]NHB91100.1 hypothetical protein [Photorhabdus cinerea]
MKEVIMFLNFSQYVPYFISIFNGKTKPSVSGWLCFSLSLLVTIIASLSLGTYSVIISCGFSLLCQIIIMFIGLRYNMALRPDKTEKFILLIIFISIIAWVGSGSPSSAIYINICVDIIGTVLIMKKLYQLPDTESLSTWFIGTIGSGIAVWYFSIAIDSLVSYIYLVTVFTSNLIIIGLIIFQKIKFLEKRENDKVF